MNNLTRDIEKSTRRVYKLFFGSRLYLHKEETARPDADLVGVDMKMQYHGDKRLSFFVDRKTLSSLRERLGAPRGAAGDSVDHDIIGEMANIITGNAVSGEGSDVCIFPPERARTALKADVANLLNFSSKLGRLYISIKEI